jgi:endonuclease-3
VDTHVERVSKRLGLVSKNDTPIDINRKLKKLIPLEYQISAHHKFIHFGRYFCVAKKPQCEACKLKGVCKY